VFQAVDRVPEDQDRIVQVIDRLADPAPQVLIGRPHRGAFQGQPRGEDLLDDLIPQLGGDAVPIFDDAGLAQAFLQPGSLLPGPADAVPQPGRSH
jgi:hypothetical protein